MTPFRLLFWNMGLTATPSMVATLAEEHEPDIIVLVESNYGIAVTVEALNVRNRFLYQIPFTIEGRFQFFVRMPPNHIRPVYDGSHLTIKHIQPVLGQNFLLAAAHLPSKLRLDAQDQSNLCSRWARSISDAETKAGHFRTVLIGDLNMNPFEPGLVGSEGLHAISSRVVAAKKTRTVLYEERSFFYNPMWSLMGDHFGTPGTYYYGSSSPITYFWNTFDQVLLRPELARHFIPGDVVVAVSVGGESLLTSNGIPDAKLSDHLPIVATLRLEDITNGSEEFMG